MDRLAIIKVGSEITGVFISPSLAEDHGFETLQVDIVDFAKTLAPWENKVLEMIEESKLVKIA